MATMKEYALAYATPNGERNAWAVFPLAAGSKVPTKGSAGCTEATTDRERISAWWTKAPHANIGIACGAINGFVVIDVDHHDDVDGADSLRELEAQMGPLPDTVEALTPNGGRHLFYKYPTGHNIRNTSGIAPGIDIRANGGYVVGMPSKLTGVAAAYQWEAASYPNERPVAPLPAAWEQWLIQRCARFELPEVIAEGKRNDTLYRFACSMRAQGIAPETILAKLTEANANNTTHLPDTEIETIYKSALRYPAGTPLKQMENVPQPERRTKDRLTIEALAEELKLRGIAVKYNLINCEYEISGRTDAGFTMSQDDLLARMHNALADQYKGASFETLAAYITFTAREHRYNPVLEALEAVKWDGVDRLPQLYTLMGLDADSLSQALVRKWLMQTVALLFNDPADPFGADGCLVLNGAQGAGKTSLFRHLAMRDAWFGEGLTVNDRDKDTTRRIVTTWIAELGEVESTLKSDISALKAFVSASIDHYRLPYGRADVVAPRMTSLCATCNSDRYLIDPTGNRRWWSVPFRRTVPREELLALDALQLWAQIFATVAPLPYHDKAGCFRLTEEERNALAVRNCEFEKPVKAQPEVEDILAKADLEKLTTRNMTATEFREHWPALRAYSAQQVGAALKKCGIEMARGSKGRRAADLPVPKTYY